MLKEQVIRFLRRIHDRLRKQRFRICSILGHVYLWHPASGNTFCKRCRGIWDRRGREVDCDD